MKDTEYKQQIEVFYQYFSAIIASAARGVSEDFGYSPEEAAKVVELAVNIVARKGDFDNE